MSTLNYDFRAEWPRAGIRSAIQPSRGNPRRQVRS